ncbi:phosphatase PAP2-related protein [Bdellovibrio bacteriovorus]|uniref:phosphatase PAP2-related protein n=1 Tax=Bdellovibrio bacteriovorus TaxID=959 RepID=UPI0035A64CFE
MSLVIKSLIAAGAVAIWLFSQKLLGKRNQKHAGVIHDSVHKFTDKINATLQHHPWGSRALLISSSLIVDALGIFLIASALFGPSIRPLFGLFFLFALRQINQVITVLPTPEGMIWKDPGFPSLFVTYGVSNDLFFSGHTALAVFGALEVASLGGPLFTALAIFIVIYEVITVLLLRAHWTMDVFAGAVTALWMFTVAEKFSPAIDQWLTQF